MYSLFPSEDLRAARARFAGYAILELHPKHRRRGMALLVSAGTLNDLTTELQGQPHSATVITIPRARRSGEDAHGA